MIFSDFFRLHKDEHEKKLPQDQSTLPKNKKLDDAECAFHEQHPFYPPIGVDMAFELSNFFEEHDFMAQLNSLPKPQEKRQHDDGSFPPTHPLHN